MKQTSLKIFVTALAIAAGFGVAEAQDRNQGRAPIDFSTLDVDGSGEIDAADLEQARENRFAEIDTDGDGQVTEAEFTAHMAARAEERAVQMFARLDADGDGTVSRDALEARDGGRRGAERLLARADTDNSGGISEAEFEAFQEKMAERRGGKGGKGGKRGG